MLPLALVAPVAVGAAALAISRAPRPERLNFGRVLAIAGALAGVVLVLAVRGEASWRTASPDAVAGTVAGFGALAAWAVVAGRSASSTAAVVGVAIFAGGLALASTADWLAPALLFWLIGSAGAAFVFWRENRLQAAVALLVSDALVVGAFGVWWIDAEVWRLPTALYGWEKWLLVAAVVVRVGVLPRVGGWSALAGLDAAVLPLMVASSFVLLPWVSSPGREWVALGAVVVAVATAIANALSERHRLSMLAPPVVTLLVAAALAAPATTVRAGTAAALTVALLALWPTSLGRAQPERGLVLSLLPLTVGFGAIVGAALACFSEVVAAPSVLDALPWAATAALLPVGLVALIVGAVVPGAAREPEGFSPTAVLATWVLVGVSIGLGLIPHSPLFPGGLAGSSDRAPWLFLLALVAGGVAARVRVVTSSTPRIERSPGPDHRAPVEPRALRVAELVVAAACGLAALSAVAYITVMGLKVGFL